MAEINKKEITIVNKTDFNKKEIATEDKTVFNKIDLYAKEAPSIVWTQYIEFLSSYGKQMKDQYLKRMREKKLFCWAELDAMLEDFQKKFDKLRIWGQLITPKRYENEN